MHWTTATIRIPERPFLMLSEVAILLGYSQRQIRRWVEAGKFPGPIRVAGGGKRWTAMAVGLWIATQEHGGEKATLVEDTEDAPESTESEKRKR